MAKFKRKRVEERIRMIDRHLENAADYLVRNTNVEGSPWLHLDDWRGKSGHPLWMKNYMIPTSLHIRAQTEKALEVNEKRANDKWRDHQRRKAAE